MAIQITLLLLIISYNFIVSLVSGSPFFTYTGHLQRTQKRMSGSPPLAYIFIRILGRDAAKINDADELLVRRDPHIIIPTFSRDDYDEFISRNEKLISSPPKLTRLFSFPLEDGIKRQETTSCCLDDKHLVDPSYESDNLMTSVYETTLFINHEEILNDPSFNKMTTEELFKLIEPMSSSDNLIQQQHPKLPQSFFNSHVLHLYRQHKLDSRIPGRRLLRGTSGSDIDDYRLRPKPAVVFFDCDDCLYFDNWNIAGHLTDKIENHCQKEFGLPQGYAYTLYKKHGTALKGLIAEGFVSKNCSDSMDGFLSKVQDLPIHDLLSPDAHLREMVSKIHPSIRKFVFTASVSHHAQRCLEALGIADLIEGIIDVKDCQFETKHSVSSFHIAMQKDGVDDPEACIFLDDSVKNIEAAREVGWRAVLVGRVGRDCGKRVSSEHAEHEIDRIHQLPEVVPELFSDQV